VNGWANLWCADGALANSELRMSKSEQRRAKSEEVTSAKQKMKSERRIANRGVFTMKSKTAQWILWAMAMSIFLGLSWSSHFDWLGVAILATSLVWYTVVPRAASR
jgi:hypothetical protein